MRHGPSASKRASAPPNAAPGWRQTGGTELATDRDEEPCTVGGGLQVGLLLGLPVVPAQAGHRVDVHTGGMNSVCVCEC